MTTQLTPLGAERVGGEQRHQGRVDPAREGDADALEAVLARRSRAGRGQRRVDLGRLERLGERLDAMRRSRPRELAGTGAHDPSRLLPRTAARSQTTSSSANWRPGQGSPSDTTTLWPSKTSSSWPPTRLQKAKPAPVARARSRDHRSRSRPLPRW